MTQKSQYPMHQIEEVVKIVIKSKFGVFFNADVANEYWAILIKPGHKYKIRIVTSHGQCDK